MEVRIKMKQKDNPQFSFMTYGDDLNPFYKYMVAMIKSGKYKPNSPQRRRRTSSAGEGKNSCL